MLHRLSSIQIYHGNRKGHERGIPKCAGIKHDHIMVIWVIIVYRKPTHTDRYLYVQVVKLLS